MELTLKSLHDDRDAFLAAGYHLPEFDYDTVHKNTVEHPHWIHFGAGNIFRAFQANVAQNLLNSGILDTGLIAAEGYDYEIIEKSYRPHDNLSILATLKADNTVEKTIVGSIMESLILDSKNEAEYARLREIFKNPSLQMASFTITEKGYATANAKGEFFPAVAADFDNGLVEAGFLGYVNDQTKVTFPWSMIDKITPRPDAKVEAMLAEDHIGGLDAVVTSKNTYIAPFVNAEECEYLVIEDAFPNGKPALDKGGIIFTDRATVDKVEKMKVCTCLNPLHTALAIYGCLLGYTLISEEMKNPLLKNMVEVIGYKEGLPVVVNPGILDPKKFIDEVVNVRIPNPFLPDSPQRIATDTSQKLSIRFGETIKAYEASPDLHTEDLKLIPLVYAGWLRYLMGIDDEGREFTPSSDPLLEEARQYVADYELSFSPKDLSKLDALLANEKIFGVNLHAIGMDTLVKQYFAELSSGVGAVAAALKKYVPEKVTL